MNAPTPLDRLLLPELDVAQLDALEEEAIFILRETAAAFERPALLFSGGKDSCVVLHLAQKAFKLAGSGEDAAAVPAPARRHRPQLPRSDRVPRPASSPSSASSSSSPTSRTRSRAAAFASPRPANRATATRA